MGDPPESWELRSSSDSDEEIPAAVQAAEPTPPVVSPFRCAVQDLPSWMLEILTSAERAHVVDWESSLGQLVKRGDQSIKFAPLPSGLRQALSYVGHTYGLRFELLTSIHGATKAACVLHRTPDTCIPCPRLTELDLQGYSAPPPSLWPTQHTPDPRHQKGTSTKVLIMKRSSGQTEEEKRRAELEQLEASARQRQGGGCADRQLEYERARARIFQETSLSEPKQQQRKPQQAQAVAPPNQARGPGAAGFGRGARVPAQPPASQVASRGRAPPAPEPAAQRWGNSVLGNQSRSLEDLRDPDYDR